MTFKALHSPELVLVLNHNQYAMKPLIFAIIVTPKCERKSFSFFFI